MLISALLLSKYPTEVATFSVVTPFVDINLLLVSLPSVPSSKFNDIVLEVTSFTHGSDVWITAPELELIFKTIIKPNNNNTDKITFCLIIPPPRS